MSTDPRDSRGYEILQGVIAQALGDEEYRERLRRDPKSVLREAGLSVSDEVEIEVHENRRDRIHFVLPSADAAEQALELDELDLVAITQHWPI